MFIFCLKIYLFLIISYQNHKKKIKNTNLIYKAPKFRWRYCWKDFDETNPTTLRKAIKSDRSELHERSKNKWTPDTFWWICSHRLLFVIFIVVIGFSRRDFNNRIDIVIRVLVCLQKIFFFFFSLHELQGGEKRKKKQIKKKNYEDTPKFQWWYY